MMAGYAGYELWDGETMNMLATDAHEERLLAIVRAQHDADGRESVARWLLVYGDNEDEEGSDDGAVVAEGNNLIARAFAREGAAT